MTNRSEQSESLDNEVTGTGDPSRPGHAGQPGDTIPSFGELQTGGETRSSLSDLGDLEQAADGPHEIVDLESRYEILGTLGRGGMGEVVRAMDLRLKREVAIKRIREEFGSSRQAMRRFLTEAVSIAALNHYNVVQIYDYGHTAEGPFLVMELVEGPTLAERLQDGPLPLEEAASMTRQLCDGLQAAHDRGLVHRDIKPANILVAGNGTPKLTDFGLAREVADTGLTRTGAVLGTLDYMAPEQKENASQVDARSDQWSLAATFYQMVTGKVPRLIRLNDLPVALQPVVEQALAENPADRFASVGEFSHAVQQAVQATGQPSSGRASLLEGQCPGCGTVNEVARKFCRGCGVSLLEDCPDCGAAEKVWERFCGDCGVDIPQAIESRMETARELQAEVQSLRSGYRHSEALEKLTPLLEAGLPALSEYRAWAETTREQLTHELDELQGQRDQLLNAAREQSAQGNISAARMYLARIPEHLQDHATWQFEEELTAADAEVKQLAREIRDATRAKRYRGLAPKVERFLELQPNDERAKKLLRKLRDRWPAEREQQVRTPPKVAAASSSRGSQKKPRRKVNSMAVGGGILTAVVVLSLMAWIDSLRTDPVESAAVASGTATSAASQRTQPTPPAVDSGSDQVQQTGDLPSPPYDLPQEPAPPRSTAKKRQAQPVDPVSPDREPVPAVSGAGVQPRHVPGGTNTVSDQEEQQATPEPATMIRSSIGMTLILVPKPTAAADPRFRQTLNSAFYAGRCEVTQQEYQRVTGTNPSFFSSSRLRRNRLRTSVSRHPVENLTWMEAVRFCNALSELDRLQPFYIATAGSDVVRRTGSNGYRLPTITEFDYLLSSGNEDKAKLAAVPTLEWHRHAWLAPQSQNMTHPVGTREPTAFGLHDVIGNVWEYCDSPGSFRGFTYGTNAGEIRYSVGFNNGTQSRASDIGFRVVREIPIRPASTDQNTPDGRQSQRNPESSLPTNAPPLFDSTEGPRTAEEAQAAQQAWADCLERDATETNSIGMKFTLIPPGEFLMGSPDSDSVAFDDEQPRHGVRITQPFYLGIHEVTQAQWKAVMGTEPWKGETDVREGENFPATYVSWEDAQEFCRKLGGKDGATCRLPTEAEWEYACRAGTTTKYHFGEDAGRLGEFAWFEDNAEDADEEYAHEVGRKRPNPFGLYDMHGNVSEWCQDGYDGYFYRQFASRPAVDPQRPSSGVSFRVSRGGSWGFSARGCRAAVRVRYSPDVRFFYLGFRVARVPPGN